MIAIVLKKLICLIGLILLSPLLAFCCVLILLEDGGPFLFRQRRVGLHQKNFTIYKLRTLKKSTPQVGTHELQESFKLKSGKVIRAMKLDEFPQLVNVLKGELNLVGPRPGLDSQIKLKESRSLLGIFKVTPGITGLSQILGYDMSNPKRLAEVDLIYIQNHTAILDIMVLLGTFITLPRDYLASKFDIPNLNKTP
ncbi:sugar transferase [Gammaproteobacteria bacterium]|nr:sugar transferase [Gammaproteobacteria bacterium]MDA9868463.1 sugar transferase [Gammaproteobacteria bacterium]